MSAPADRARYYSAAQGFNIARPPVPARTFLAERDTALDAASPTGLVPCDASAELGVGFPATTPLLLARYARVRTGEKLATTFAATGQMYFVIQGCGESRAGADSISWGPGDAFVLPGGGETTHVAQEGDGVLWVVTNEPQLAFERARPPAPGTAPVEAVHFPAAEIRRQLDRVYALPPEIALAGRSIAFASAARERERTCLPSMTFAMNSLPPGGSQRAHRHNAVAVTLIVQGERCHSMVDGRRVDWHPHATMITPPGAPHSHHNAGEARALFLIVQDGGLHYHTRTMGFAYTEPERA